MDIWNELGINSTRDRKSIKRAYAQRLKQIRPETHPEEFKRLRRAYEFALELAEGKNNHNIFLEQKQSRLSFPRNFPVSQRRIKPSPFKTASPRMEEQLNINSDVTKILDSLKRGDLEAIHGFKRTLDQHDYMNLEYRDRFEDLLARRVISAQPFPYEFLQVVSETFHWEERDRHISNQFGAHYRYILNRLRARRKIKELADLANMHGEQHCNLSNRLAIKALLNGYRPTYFRILAMSSAVTGAVRRMLNEFKSLYPDVLKYELDQQTLQWWDNTVHSLQVQWRHIFFTLLGAPFLFLIFQKEWFPVRDPQMGMLLYIFTNAALFMSLVGLDYLSMKWRDEWKDDAIPNIRRFWYDTFGLRSDAVYRILWCVLLGLCVLGARWLDGLWIIIPLLCFYVLMIMVINWRDLAGVSIVAALMLLLTGYVIDNLVSHSVLDSSHYKYVGAASFVQFMGMASLFLSLVLIFSGLYIFFKKRISN